MSKHHILYPALGVALIVAAFSWLKAHDAWRYAEAFQQGQDAQIKAAQKQGDQAQKHSEAVGKQEQKDVKDIQQAAARPLSSSEVRQMIQDMLPKANVQTVQTPQGPVITVPDTPEVRQEIQQQKASCDICQVSLKARNEQFQDAQMQLQAKQDEIAALRLERDKWKVAAGKGSGFWARAREWGIRAGFAAGGYAAGRMMK